MEYSASQIEKEYYKRSFSDLSRMIRDYVLNVFLHVFENDYAGFIERYIVRAPNAPTSALARMFLVHNVADTSHAYRQLLQNKYHTLSAKRLKKKIYSEDDNAFILSLVHQAIADCQGDEIRKNTYCKNAIMSCDVAASLKVIEFMKPEDVPVFKKALGINGSLQPLQNSAINIREIRNELDAHDSSLTEISRELYVELLNDMKNVLNICELHELQTVRTITLDSVQSSNQKVFCDPIFISSVKQQVEDYQEEILRNSCLNKQIDFTEGKIYLCRMDEVIGVFHNLTYNSSLSRKLKESEQKISELRGQLQAMEGKADNGTMSFAGREAALLPLLSGYQSGHLSYDQQNELWKQTTVFIDAKAWLNQDVRHFVAYRLVQALENNGRKLYVDWPSRVELFDLENLGNEEARTARMLMSDLHRRGKLAYLKQTDIFSSSLDYQLSIAQQNDSRHFILISEDTDLYRSILSRGLNNVIPVAVIGDDLTILKSSRILLNTFCVTPESDADEDTDEEPETEEPVSNQEEPKDGTLYRSGNQRLELTEEIASGGEGTIYRTSLDGCVAKIFHDDQLNDERIEKLQYMLAHDPGIDECAWPKEMLYRNGKPVGFLMREIGSEYKEMSKSVLLLNRRSIQENVMNKWNRKTLVRLCIRLCDLFSALHENGILMGDINPNNILVDLQDVRNIKVAIVDCDSMQMGRFHCLVGMKTYTNPDIYRRLNTNEPRYDEFYRTMDDELYAFTSLIFRILMLNGSPYAGKGTQSIDEAMRSYNFSYRTEESSGKDTPEGPYRMIWNNTTKKLRDDFEMVFRGKGYVQIGTLREHLDQYRKDINKKIFTDELIPNAYWNTPEHNNNIDIVCETCGKPSNMPKERHAGYLERHMPLMCPNCRTLLEAQKYSPARVKMTCRECSREYEENLYEAFMIQHGVKKHTPCCPDCREKKKNKMTVVCDRCGRSMTINQLRLEKLADDNKKPLCDNCLAEIRKRKKGDYYA